MLTPIILTLLALAWATYLGWHVISRRVDHHSGRSIQSFNRQLSVIGGATSSGETLVAHPRRLAPEAPKSITVLSTPSTVTQAQRRRIEIIFTLLGGAIMALFLGVAFFRWVLFVHVVLDAMLISYLVLLARNQQLAEERAQKVRHLPSALTPGFPELDRLSGEPDDDHEVELPVAVGSGLRVLREVEY